MQPTANLGEDKTGQSIVMPPEVNAASGPRRTRSRVIMGVSLGLVVMVTVAATYVLTVYFGHKMAQDCVTDILKTYPLRDGGVLEEAQYEYGDDTLTVVPNKLKLIQDAEHNLHFYSMYDPNTYTYGDCMAFPQADFGFEEQEDTQEDGLETQFRTTNATVPRHQLSEAVIKLCGDGEIYLMEKITSKVVTKRDYCGKQIYEGYVSVGIYIPYDVLRAFWFFRRREYLGKFLVSYGLYDCYYNGDKDKGDKEPTNGYGRYAIYFRCEFFDQSGLHIDSYGGGYGGNVENSISA